MSAADSARPLVRAWGAVTDASQQTNLSLPCRIQTEAAAAADVSGLPQGAQAFLQEASAAETLSEAQDLVQSLVLELELLRVATDVSQEVLRARLRIAERDRPRFQRRCASLRGELLHARATARRDAWRAARGGILLVPAEDAESVEHPSSSGEAREDPSSSGEEDL